MKSLELTQSEEFGVNTADELEVNTVEELEVNTVEELEVNTVEELGVDTADELEVDTFDESLHEEIENEVQARQHIDITSIVKELNCCHFVLFILYLYLAAK